MMCVCVWGGGAVRLKSWALFPALGNGEEVVYIASSPPCWLLTFSWHQHMRRWLGEERKQKKGIKSFPADRCTFTSHSPALTHCGETEAQQEEKACNHIQVEVDMGNLLMFVFPIYACYKHLG